MVSDACLVDGKDVARFNRFVDKVPRYPGQTADIHRSHKRQYLSVVRGHVHGASFARRESCGRRFGVQCQLGGPVSSGQQRNPKCHSHDNGAIDACLLHICRRLLPGVPRDVYDGKVNFEVSARNFSFSISL